MKWDPGVQNVDHVTPCTMISADCGWTERTVQADNAD